jgi:hypothetical protein
MIVTAAVWLLALVSALLVFISWQEWVSLNKSDK